MKKIARFTIKQLSREELLDFNDKVLNTARSCCSGHKSFEVFERAASRYAEAMSNKACKVSTALADYDRETDKAWMAFNYHLKASVWHPSPEIREAAEKIRAIFDQTPSPVSLNYDREYGALKNLLAQLDKLPAELFEKTHSSPYRLALKNTVELFLSAAEEKVDTLSRREVGVVKDAATACCKAWQGLLRYIEVQAEYSPSPEINETVDKLNVVCTELKRRLG